MKQGEAPRKVAKNGENQPFFLTYSHRWGTFATLNDAMSVEVNMQDVHVTFRANQVVITALAERANRAGCSVSEYLRAIVREKVGLQ